MSIVLEKRLRGIAKLFRFIPVIAWSFSAIILGIGLALNRLNTPPVNYAYLFLLFFVVSMLQGLASHAINDIYDWHSGTDRISNGILSGGTTVIKNELLGINQVKAIGMVAMLSGVLAGMYLVVVRGLFILVLLLVGMWSTVAYTVPPIRLSYRPLAGEWLGAWPAMAACTLGTFYILTGSVTGNALAGAVLHATFSVAWLMQHHLPDIEADLQATPIKLTTVAFVSQKWGRDYTRFVVAGYFLILVLLALTFTFAFHRAFLISVIFGLISIWLALGTDPANIKHITRRQTGMIALSVGNALGLAVIFGLRII